MDRKVFKEIWFNTKSLMLNTANTSIRQKLKTAPSKPGIYWFTNKSGKIIYIGKALSLKHRLKSYFVKSVRNPKTKLLVSKIHSINWQVVPSEFEALLLEAKLVRDHKPKYNIQLKDDKSPLYIAITKKPYRIFSLRQTDLKTDKLLDWYGPFTSGRDVKLVLRTLRRIFPYCSCQQPPRRQCLYFHLNLCPGYQNLKSNQYQQHIKQVRQILSGKSKQLVKKLEKKMNEAASSQKFEVAQTYKRQWQSLQYVTINWKGVPSDHSDKAKILIKLQKLISKYQGINPTTISKIEGYDISNLGSHIMVGSLVVFIDGVPDKSQYRRFHISLATPGVAISSNTGQNDPAAIKQVVSRRLKHKEWLYPQLMLIDGGKTQVKAALAALQIKNMANQICLLGLTKPKEKKKTDTILIPQISHKQLISWKKLSYSPHSPILQLLQQIRDESHRFAQSYYRVLHRQKHRAANKIN